MQKRLLIALFIALVASIGLASIGPAAAQEASGEASALPPAPYRSPMRDQCQEELAKDRDWYTDVRDQIAPEIHEEDAKKMLTNRRHVVLAYAALWALVAGFVVFLWLRQRGLQAEIARLEREIEQATKDA